MHPETWLNFPIDGGRGLGQYVRFLSFSLDSNQQPKSQFLSFVIFKAF